MKPALVLLTMITSCFAHAGYDVTQQTAALGENQKVTLDHSTTFSLGGMQLKWGS